MSSSTSANKYRNAGRPLPVIPPTKPTSGLQEANKDPSTPQETGTLKTIIPRSKSTPRDSGSHEIKPTKIAQDFDLNLGIESTDITTSPPNRPPPPIPSETPEISPKKTPRSPVEVVKDRANPAKELRRSKVAALIRPQQGKTEKGAIDTPETTNEELVQSISKPGNFGSLQDLGTIEIVPTSPRRTPQLLRPRSQSPKKKPQFEVKEPQLLQLRTRPEYDLNASVEDFLKNLDDLDHALGSDPVDIKSEPENKEDKK